MDSVTNSIFFRDTSAFEINKIIMKMKNKSCHISTYPVKILKLICDIVSPILSIIVGKSLSDGVFPASFKKARVFPLHKGGYTKYKFYRKYSRIDYVFYDLI